MDKLFQYHFLFELGNPIEYTEHLNEDLMGNVAPLATITSLGNAH